MSSAAFASAAALSRPAHRWARPVSARAPTRKVARSAPPVHRVRMEAGDADAADDYWPGEIVCTDCGYVYNNAKRKVKFEDLPDSYVCPQCNASKRRFARKAGDFVEKTAGTDNTPIYVFSVAGIVGMLAFGFWASKNL